MSADLIKRLREACATGKPDGYSMLTTNEITGVTDKMIDVAADRNLLLHDGDADALSGTPRTFSNVHASRMDPAKFILNKAIALIAEAESLGVVLTIEVRPTVRFAMGRLEMKAETRCVA